MARPITTKPTAADKARPSASALTLPTRHAITRTWSAYLFSAVLDAPADDNLIDACTEAVATSLNPEAPEQVDMEAHLDAPPYGYGAGALDRLTHEHVQPKLNSLLGNPRPPIALGTGAARPCAPSAKVGDYVRGVYRQASLPR